MTAPRRGAAQERSPGRSPGFVFVLNPAPEGRKTRRTSFAPSGLSVSLQAYPGLAPGATFLSRSAAGNIVNRYRNVQSPGRSAKRVIGPWSFATAEEAPLPFFVLRDSF